MLTIHLHQDGRVQLVDKGQTPHSTRYVALEEMVHAFRGQAMSSPILPEGCVQYWSGHGYQIATIYKEAHVREMHFYEETYKVPVPGTIFAFRIEQHGEEQPYMCESAVFTTVGMWNGEKTQLCAFPYGNVYDEHTICWGELEFENLYIHQLTGMPDIFLSSPFNDDLSGHYLVPDGASLSLREFWQEMDGRDKFPEKYLSVQRSARVPGGAVLLTDALIHAAPERR